MEHVLGILHWITGLFSLSSYRKLILVSLTYLTVFLISCAKPTETISPNFVGYQVPGCNQTTGTRTLSDSCFSYRFNGALLVDLCATGNCCPDAERFTIKHNFQNDTIVVTIADTAAQSCRCICRYLLHFEFGDLPYNSYMFICRREDYSSRVVIYSLRVYRYG